MHLVPSTQGHPHPTWVFFGDPRSNGFPCSESSLASAYNNSHGDYKVISKSCIARKMLKMPAKMWKMPAKSGKCQHLCCFSVSLSDLPFPAIFKVIITHYDSNYLLPMQNILFPPLNHLIIINVSF